MNEANQRKIVYVIVAAVLIGLGIAKLSYDNSHKPVNFTDTSNATTVSPSTATTPPPPVAAPVDPATDNTVSQYYYYCWNSGTPYPHHLGYRVSGDHFCTNAELHNSGMSGY